MATLGVANFTRYYLPNDDPDLQGDDTRKLFEGQRVARWVNIQIVAIRKPAMLNAAALLLDLRIPPNNRLEALSGDRRPAQYPRQ